MSKAPFKLPLSVFNSNWTTCIHDADGEEVIGWPGFDDSSVSRKKHAARAHYIVRCVNSWSELRRQHEGDEAAAFTVFRDTEDGGLEPVGSMPGELDAAIDAAIAAESPKGAA